MKALPNIKSVIQHEGFQKYFRNTFWLFIEKFLRLLSGLVVGVLVARYLGPEEFGLLNYAMSFVALFLAISGLGLDNIVVKRLLSESESENKLLGTAFVLKFIAGFGVLVAVFITTLLSNNSTVLNTIIMVIAAAAVFQSFTIIDFYFQARVMSKYVVFANIISLTITALLKLYFIYTEASLVYFALAFTLDALIVAAGLLYFYWTQGHKMFKWKFDRAVSKSLLKQSWPLIMAGLVVTVYMKIDQIMITEMLGPQDNGNYAAAVRISETWYFIPMVICTSLFPAIINSKNRADGSYEKRLQSLFDLMVGIALFVAIPITFLSEPLILFLFGESFNGAISVLTIHIWAGIFVTLGVSSSLWLVNENLQRLSFYRSLIGAVVNIILNFLLIPKYGISGAALTTLFSQFAATYLFDLFHPKTRRNFVMKTKSLLLISPTMKLINAMRQK